METVPIVAAEKRAESVVSVSRCSDTLAASMTYLYSACHSYIKKTVESKTLEITINSLDDFFDC